MSPSNGRIGGSDYLVYSVSFRKIAFAFTLWAFVLPFTVYAQNAQVTDGDTLKISGESHRLKGIDAPELKQRCKKPNGKTWLCGMVSTITLHNFIDDRPVSCQSQKKRGYYNRKISICFVGGENLNAWMVRKGWAMADHKYGTRYGDLERQAKTAQKGIWKGSVMPPWLWRKKRRKAHRLP